jgi:hypothetical protein
MQLHKVGKARYPAVKRLHKVKGKLLLTRKTTTKAFVAFRGKVPFL